MKATTLYHKISEQTEQVKLLDEKIQALSANENWDVIRNDIPLFIQNHIELLEEQQIYLKKRAEEKPWQRFFHWIFGEPQHPYIPELRS